jgi:hypothetical protein
MFEKTKQGQTVSGGSTALQVQGDVNVNQGMTPSQMAEVMLELMSVTRRFTDDAMQTVQERQSKFEEAVLKQMADKEKSNTEAFRDPDFQYTLGRAQEAFIRSGDESVKETLADIIARRSKADTGTRLAYTLNDAVIRAANLTVEEFATLSVVYITRYATNRSIRNVAMFAEFVRSNCMPFVENMSGAQSSLWHIEAQGCGRVATGAVDLRTAWVASYGGMLGKGITLEKAQNAVAPEYREFVAATLTSCVRDNALLQPNALSQSSYVELQAGKGIPIEGLNNIWKTFEGTIPSGQNLVAMLESDIPNFGEFYEKWESTPVKRLELNSVGIAVAHANATRVIGLTAPLSVWIS